MQFGFCPALMSSIDQLGGFVELTKPLLWLRCDPVGFCDHHEKKRRVQPRTADAISGQPLKEERDSLRRLLRRGKTPAAKEDGDRLKGEQDPRNKYQRYDGHCDPGSQYSVFINPAEPF
jgi:hypothetical protein